MVLIREPKDAVLSLVIRDPISVDQALKYYISFYETTEKYPDSYVLGRFEDVTEDFGRVIGRLNEKFGTTFSLFRHDEENVKELFAGMDDQARKKYGERLWERKVQRPAAGRERIKDEIEYDLQNPKRMRLIARAEAVYDRLTNQVREPAQVEQEALPEALHPRRSSRGRSHLAVPYLVLPSTTLRRAIMCLTHGKVLSSRMLPQSIRH